MKIPTLDRRHLSNATCCFVAAALTIAMSIELPAQENADVQGFLNAGEFGAANDLANDRTVPEATARRQTLQGGTGADFDPLIQLIINQTDGPWASLDGEGAEDPEPFESGVRVDPNGVLEVSTLEDLSGNLAARGVKARKAALNADMAQSSNLRLVSLTRLEKAVADRLVNGKPVVESMKKLAGLSQIEYVFVYPDTGEIVLGGPAEAWEYNEYGMAVGQESGRPILQLDDLVTVLRTFDDGGMRMFGCSIDPKPENIKAVQEYAAASQAKGALSPAGVRRWAKNIGQILGLQDISVYGVSADSRVARVLVEADYRMKLIGIGELEAGSDIPDYFTLLKRNPQFINGGLDALRWWMTMKYESIMHSADHDAFQLRGSGVKCQSENQFLTANGQRKNTGKSEPINRQFAENFTQHYAALAESDPIFADLQGIFDLALVAALIDRNQLDWKADWDRGVFDIDGDYQPATYTVPRQTESVVNHRVFNGKDVVLQVAGGVNANLLAVVKNSEINEQSPHLEGTAEEAKAQDVPANRWWWDAK